MTDEQMAELLAEGDAAMQERWIEIIRYLREQNQLDDLEHAIATNGVAMVLAGVDAAAQRLAEEWAAQFVAAARAAAASMGTQGRFVAFNVANPAVGEMLERRRFDLITQMRAETQDLVQQIIRRGIAEGVNPREMARRIQESIGLTAEQDRIIENFRASLTRGVASDARRRALADLRYAVRPGLTEEQVGVMVDVYRRNWIAYRAEVIARTEALRSVHEGVEELFRQAFESGELSADEIVVTWNCAMRPRSRDHHVSMNGQRRAPGESFTSGKGVSLRYPGDPSAPADEVCNCVCVLSRRMQPRREVAF